MLLNQVNDTRTLSVYGKWFGTVFRLSGVMQPMPKAEFDTNDEEPSHLQWMKEANMEVAFQPQPLIEEQLKEVFAHFSTIALVVLFGSAAVGRQRTDSDLDIAVAAKQILSVDEKIALIAALAERTGRTIDLIDLHTISEPLLGQILRHGKRVLGSDTLYGELISRHLFEQADFMPYRARLLAERRMAWIGV